MTTQSERIAPQAVSGRPDIAFDHGLIDVLVAKLRKSSYAPLRRVSGELRDGRIVLHGKLPNFYLKQLAQETVLPMLGGRRLHNKVTVVRRAPFVNV